MVYFKSALKKKKKRCRCIFENTKNWV